MARRLASALALVFAFASAPAQAAPDLTPYAGPGAWVDIYERTPWRRPEQTVARLAASGVKTLYVETANWRQRRNVDIVFPEATDRLIEAAHANGMRVVAWYLPSFAAPALDLRRSLAAIGHRTPTGQGFDSFALDIESNQVRSITRRNAAMLTLSQAIRTAVGPDYALGAIVPDQRSTAPAMSLWPFFPYAEVAPIYDVFLPMAYSSFRVRGATAVYRYTRANLDHLRATGKPIHLIGGLANRLNAREARAVAKAARDGGAIGTSFYNVTLSRKRHYDALAAYAR